MTTTTKVPPHHSVNYLEFAADKLEASKTFFETVFEWQFTDYGPDYAAFVATGIEGGFYRAPLSARTEQGSVLVVLFSSNLEQSEQQIVAAGGVICKPIFSFPGGRRFHFTEPSGNELAIWSDR
ncbi:glyoxalase [Neiella marina]|uniref:Glyoxalase n=1 Tax=Neiella marina TaxID=508461 RepID=A0A8J2U328_9GAMM|nr:VOC family protein [Neiella marina]GGA69002.1 glyoxalase [Neiella marina]